MSRCHRTSCIARQRLRVERQRFSRYRWRTNFADFSKLLDAGIIVMKRDVLEELVKEAMNDSLSDPARYTDQPQKALTEDPPAQS